MTIIGIDPDVRACGVAIMVDGKYKMVETYRLWALFKLLDTIVTPHMIYIEDARLLGTSSYHGGGRGSVRDVGKNMAISILLDDYCTEMKLTHKMVKPAGYSKLFKDVRIFQQSTGWTGRTNEDSRAAAAIVYVNK